MSFQKIDADIKFDSKVLTDVAEEDKAPTVKVRVVGIEVAGDEISGGRLRQMQRDMYDRRTSGGTLFESDQQSA